MLPPRQFMHACQIIVMLAIILRPKKKIYIIIYLYKKCEKYECISALWLCITSTHLGIYTIVAFIQKMQYIIIIIIHVPSLEFPGLSKP